jgi:hypothetical protein
MSELLKDILYDIRMRLRDDKGTAGRIWWTYNKIKDACIDRRFAPRIIRVLSNNQPRTLDEIVAAVKPHFAILDYEYGEGHDQVREAFERLKGDILEREPYPYIVGPDGEYVRGVVDGQKIPDPRYGKEETRYKLSKEGWQEARRLAARYNFRRIFK